MTYKTPINTILFCSYKNTFLTNITTVHKTWKAFKVSKLNRGHRFIIKKTTTLYFNLHYSQELSLLKVNGIALFWSNKTNWRTLILTKIKKL